MGRVAGFAAAAAAVLAATIRLRHEPDTRRAAGAVPVADPLARELDRCREIGMAAKDDPDCAAAWAENRRRFFAPLADHSAPPATNGAQPTPEAR